VRSDRIKLQSGRAWPVAATFDAGDQPDPPVVAAAALPGHTGILARVG